MIGEKGEKWKANFLFTPRDDSNERKLFSLLVTGELSSYSVFNPNQERIPGTFDDKDMVPLVLVS